ncbi:hypothetical protein KA005_51840, partial [bacterium]|nr:hypothetical protein [bacterium]
FGFHLPQSLFQPSQPFPRILNLSNTRVSVFPEVEEFLVMLRGFADHIYFSSHAGHNRRSRSAHLAFRQKIYFDIARN